MKTLTLALTAAALATPGHADMDIARAFARCAGQFSAAMEHAWLMQDPRASAYQEDRAAFVSLLDSVVADDGPEVLHLRIEAKFAQANLLQQADFGTDPYRSQVAGARANAQISTCRLLLLGG